MTTASTLDDASRRAISPDSHPTDLAHLRHAIEHAAHLLPTQGPIDVFVHHNTLHAFEDLPFEQAVRAGQELYGCEPYLPEERYRAKLCLDRVLPEDLSAILLKDLGDDADVLIGFMGTRYHLRLAMLEHPLHTGPDAELRWLVSESDALARFRPETSPESKQKMLDETRRWVSHALQSSGGNGDSRAVRVIESLAGQFPLARRESWNPATWESFSLHLLWRICHNGVHGVKRFAPPTSPLVRHRDLLRHATGRDADALVHEILIRFCAAFLDQGFGNWSLPDRDAGFLPAFVSLYSGGCVERWLKELPAEVRRLQAANMTPLESIAESLTLLGVSPGEEEAYITQTLLALRGWAGMIRQMETNAEWTVRPAPAGTLTEFLAVRLILDRLAAASVYRDVFGRDCPLDEMRDRLSQLPAHAPRVSVEQRAYVVFQLAQVRGWSPRDLHQQSKEAWTRLVEEIDRFDEFERRRIYHLAYERRYRNCSLDAVAACAGDELQRRTASRPETPAPRPSFQLVTCIDDREESFRRHLEEVAPTCETYSAAGFFAVAMYFRGAGEANFRPLCPVVIKPQHYVTEEVAYSLTASSRHRKDARRLLGTASHRWHLGTRSFLAGIVTAVLGSFASIPLVTRILFPRLTAQALRLFGSLIQPPAVTELHLDRESAVPGPADEELGYSLDEKTAIVARILEDIGLTRNLSRLVLFAGHGSGSLNNPHESAYNCGACSGGRGGPNARAFAQMANDPRVREALARRGLLIPADTVFIGAFHNTCDEDVVYYDLDRVPRSHRAEFERLWAAVDEARARDAHERCRRFESAPLDMTPAAALTHVEERAEDLSQARPEYNHATNALGFVGRRVWSRGLFLDRRVFLTSYDPSQDDEKGSILARILAAAVPVCAGISLEYYFSCVDPAGYGCGSKLPHNITSLLGVMEGAASDLRPGLSQQMIEIHEPVRILFVIETTTERMLAVMSDNPTIDRLVRNEWIQLATLDPDSAELHVFRTGRFRPYVPESTTLPRVRSSLEWYRGQRDHLGFARIVSDEGGQLASPGRATPRPGANSAEEAA